jgi:DNA topoisomerase-1
MAAILTISRQKLGSRFVYRQADSHLTDKKLIAWIESLAIPPAWEEVKISHSPRTKVYAQGYDNAGRRQAIYNPSFRSKQERLKFDRILRFAEALPALRRQVGRDLDHKRLSKDKVLACIVKLIDTAYFRVGNERYAQQHQSYGITTLRHKHLDVSNDTVTFEFIGKSGQRHLKQVTDKHLAHIVKKLDGLPGYEIFRYKDEHGVMHDIDSANVNAYIKTHMGEEFSAKDFRTWGGTLLATTELLASEYVDDKQQRRKTVTAVVKKVAKRLGNTPAIARSSYIDPRVIAAYVDSSDIIRVRRAMDKMRPRRYMSRDEQCVLKLLTKQSRKP